MMTIKLLAGLAVALGLGGAAHAADVGVCTWQRLPAHERSEVISAYQQTPRTAAALWKTLDPEVKAIAATCANPGLPTFWVLNAARVEAQQVSMADELQTARGLDRRQLDAVWADAAPDIRECFGREAARLYRLAPPNCPNPNARYFVIQQLGIPFTAAQRSSVQAALFYFTAKAHSEYVNALVARAGRGG